MSTPDLVRTPYERPPRDYVVFAAAAIVVLFVVVALLADWVAPFGFASIDLRARNVPPVGFGGTTRHFLGTDELGRDILSRMMISVRVSLVICVLASLISATIGILLGLLAAMGRRWVDSVIRVAIDFHASVPFLTFALAVLAFFGNNLTLFVCLLGTYGWERYARLVRALALVEYSKGYVAALRRAGASRSRIAFGHVLRNVMAVILVNWTISLPELMLLESGLSFLGVGIQPPLASLGNMVGLGRDYIVTSWW
ncbi:MAG: ABC transporter permease, partial [Proteobacteria bacterium]|nr:ABC transporter permease [Pseudomonadota bacterium]